MVRRRWREGLGLDPVLRRRALLGAVVLSLVFAGWGAATAPERQTLRHLDHEAYELTLDAMRDGAAYYPAYRDAYGQLGVDLGRARAFRQPALFLLERLVPAGALLATFFVLPVLATSLLGAHLSAVPPVGALAGVWVARAGVLFGVDAWLLAELWAVPLVAGSCLAWLRGRAGAAAALACAAVLVREVAVLLLLGLLADAIWRRRAIRPYVVALVVSLAAYAAHVAVAGRYVVEPGNDADLLGTGDAGAVADMTGFLVFQEPVLGLLAWFAGLAAVVAFRLWPLLPLALLPLAGVVVDRPYWGWLFMPVLVACLPGVHRPAGPATATGGAP